MLCVCVCVCPFFFFFSFPYRPFFSTVADAGGASVIVAAMRAFSENEDVQSEGCGAVIGGCDGHAHCQSAFGRAGAAAAVVAALEAFPENDVVASRG